MHDEVPQMLAGTQGTTTRSDVAITRLLTLVDSGMSTKHRVVVLKIVVGELSVTAAAAVFDEHFIMEALHKKEDSSQALPGRSAASRSC